MCWNLFSASLDENACAVASQYNENIMVTRQHAKLKLSSDAQYVFLEEAESHDHIPFLHFGSYKFVSIFFLLIRKQNILKGHFFSETLDSLTSAFFECSGIGNWNHLWKHHPEWRGDDIGEDGGNSSSIQAVSVAADLGSSVFTSPVGCIAFCCTGFTAP